MRIQMQEAMMRIAEHSKSYIVVLSDASAWRIWRADMADTLRWLPRSEIDVVKIDDETCSHALVNRSDGSHVRVIKAHKKWRLVLTSNGHSVIENPLRQRWYPGLANDIAPRHPQHAAA
jgi:hypothetical protein